MLIGDEVVNDLAPKDRDIAMVFQNYALYPHMTVRDNMGFALKLAKVDQGEIDTKVEEAARILDLQDHLERKPANLSGGQRQRVAMGRAIVRDPKAFLMDEPLSNLDAKLRVQMRTEVSRIQKRLGTTMVYVTHDQTEAMTLGDRVAVMRAGVIQQVDSPKVLYEDPRNLFVAGFIGSPAMNFLPGEARRRHARAAVRLDAAARGAQVEDQGRRRRVARRDRGHAPRALRGRGGGRRAPDRRHEVQGHDRRRRVDGLRALRLLRHPGEGGGVRGARRAGRGRRPGRAARRGLGRRRDRTWSRGSTRRARPTRARRSRWCSTSPRSSCSTPTAASASRPSSRPRPSAAAPPSRPQRRLRDHAPGPGPGA